ncbi:virulence factor Mce family protein [Mycolicibacterium sp. YH-1]|uniref:virulence factor Mce family protein n=1 Tax=Mycolicibacterium sp. YH-1 TaxID=2908837 RepID=UPI001F4C4FE9|nr:virulence factor Mce family protein [Mycolicibacterium sp. YH-1]UNB54533.1 virulence factor Mce family protein [Mycolicibacterium sp. YH-1]
MTRRHNIRIALAIALTVLLVSGGYLAVVAVGSAAHRQIVAYFENSNGVFVGDDVRIRGVNVGKIESIEPEPERVKISFWIDDKYAVPADVKAAILSPTLVTSRAIQLTPPYVSGAMLPNNAVIPDSRTAVPLEFDDLRAQLEKLTNSLQPTQPGGVSALGEFVNTAADNLRGQGPAIRDSIIKLSQTVSALGDHSDDIFTSVKNLSMLVSALDGSTDLIVQLNQNLASVSGALADDPGEVADAARDLNAVVGDVQAFVAENRETLGTTTDKLTSLSQVAHDSLADIKQLLHVAPTALSNFVNIYQPAQGTFSGVLAPTMFANPISFLCGAIQAASRFNAEQSSKLCVQYLAPIIKNRQYNFLPMGLNPFVGATARPNEVTYSEDWMRPDYVPPQPATPATPATAASVPAPLPAEAPPPPEPAEAATTDPQAGLQGMMVPPGGGS